jgi:hypothetical protein
VLGYIDFRWPDLGWRGRYPRVAKWFARLEERRYWRCKKPLLVSSVYDSLEEAKAHAEAAITRLQERVQKRKASLSK